MSQTIVPPTEQAAPSADEPSVAAELQRMDRDLQRVRSERDGWLLAILGFSALALACAALFVIIGVNDNEGGTEASSAATTIDATLSEFAIELPVTEVAEGGSIEVTNTGALVHNLAVVGSDNRSREPERWGHRHVEPRRPRAGGVHDDLRDPRPRGLGDDRGLHDRRRRRLCWRDGWSRRAGRCEP